MDLSERTIEPALKNVEEGGRPFACVIARDGKIVAESPNLVAQTHDPTAHAEGVAIREAWTRLQTEDLSGCEIYVLAHPCPMCLGALYYCSPDRVVFITTRGEYSRYYKYDRRSQVCPARDVVRRVLQAVAGAPAADGPRAERAGYRGLRALAGAELVSHAGGAEAPILERRSPSECETITVVLELWI